MKIGKKHILMAALCLTGCTSTDKTGKVAVSPRSEEMLVGNDRDEHGCIGSAGYTWCEVQNDCIRLFEKGIRLEAVEGKQSAFIVFSPDSTLAELFFSGGEQNEILQRRPLPAGGYAWNVEDDDTKNVRFVNGIWTISQRDKLIYQAQSQEGGKLD